MHEDYKKADVRIYGGACLNIRDGLLTLIPEFFFFFFCYKFTNILRTGGETGLDVSASVLWVQGCHMFLSPSGIPGEVRLLQRAGLQNCGLHSVQQCHQVGWRDVKGCKIRSSSFVPPPL